MTTSSNNFPVEAHSKKSVFIRLIRGLWSGSSYGCFGRPRSQYSPRMGEVREFAKALLRRRRFDETFRAITQRRCRSCGGQKENEGQGLRPRGQSRRHHPRGGGIRHAAGRSHHQRDRRAQSRREPPRPRRKGQLTKNTPSPSVCREIVAGKAFVTSVSTELSLTRAT